MNSLARIWISFFLIVGWALTACQPIPTALPPQPSLAPTAVSTPTLPPGMTASEAAALGTLVQVNDYPLYTLHLSGEYRARELPPRSVPAAVVAGGSWGCSLFAALADPANRIYGRNFDWRYSPALLLFLDPPGKYASVSMVDIEYLGYDRERAEQLAEAPLAERAGLLNAPSLPFDGMNETGLAIGMAAVPSGEIARDPHLPAIDSILAIRKVLDEAATVEEAVRILSSYSIDMTGGPDIHYLVADAAGKAALAEYVGGKLVVTPNDSGWHLATNFIRAKAGPDPAGNCWRYDKIHSELSTRGGTLAMDDAMALLKDVSQTGDSQTQWSVVYSMTTGDVRVVTGGDYRHVSSFRLER